MDPGTNGPSVSYEVNFQSLLNKMGKEVVLEESSLKFSESRGYENSKKVYESKEKKDMMGQPKGKLTHTGLEDIPGFNFLSPGSKKIIARSISTTPFNDRLQKEF